MAGHRSVRCGHAGRLAPTRDVAKEESATLLNPLRAFATAKPVRATSHALLRIDGFEHSEVLSVIPSTAAGAYASSSANKRRSPYGDLLAVCMMRVNQRG